MNNLKRDFKNLSRGRRGIFKEMDFTKISYNNKEALGKITKRDEEVFYKTMKKLHDKVKEIEGEIEAVFNEGLEQGFSVEDLNILILQGLTELDLEEAKA